MKKISCFALAVLLAIALAAPALALSPDGFVTDDAGLLTPSQQSSLEAYARELSQDTGVGVYILLTDDHTALGSRDVFDAGVAWYLDNGLGLGDRQSGILLLLSMDSREYALVLYGDAKSRISRNDETWLEDEFLGEFSRDRWASGLERYLEGAGTVLYGQRPDGLGDSIGSTVVILVLCFGVSYLVMFLVKKTTMESVAKQSGAGAYMTPNGTQIHFRQDQFLHRRVSTRRIQTSSSGSRSRSSGGARGRSGRF